MKEWSDMTASADALEAQILEATSALAQMEQQLRSTQAQVAGLGFFARGFVEKDIRGATGRSFGDWITAASRLRAVLSSTSKGQQPDAKRAIEDELIRVAVLREYLQRAPQKINMVPAAVLKPQQRAEFLKSVASQEESLHALETRLRSIAVALSPA
jgi:hypothetical protein